MAVTVRDNNKKIKSTFLHIPKNAGSSIRDWMMKNVKHSVDERPGPHRTRKELESSLGNLGVTFCVVRNPYHRAVSAYLYKIKKVGNSFKEKYPTFESYILNTKDKVIIEQHQYFNNCDFILKFENLIEEFAKIQQLYNCYIPLPHSNKTKNNDWKSYYTESAKEKVELIFKNDLKILGYEYQ